MIVDLPLALLLADNGVPEAELVRLGARREDAFVRLVWEDLGLMVALGCPALYEKAYNLGELPRVWAPDENVRAVADEVGRVSLVEAFLPHAYVPRAKLHEALATGIRLPAAYLVAAQAQGAQLGHANLVGADLFKADLTRASLRRADLRGANLAGADLTGADLTDAHLTGANLYGAALEGARFDGADLRGAQLEATVGDAASWDGAQLLGAAWPDHKAPPAGMCFATVRRTVRRDGGPSRLVVLSVQRDEAPCGGAEVAR